MNSRVYIAICTLFITVLSISVECQTAGSLDTSFGVLGKVTTSIGTNLNSGARAVAVQPDGKIVATGYSMIGTDPNTRNQDFAITRYNADGSLDITFGGTGIVTTDLTGFPDIAFAVAIQADGKIVVAGQASIDPNVAQLAFGVVRYNANGSLDTTFGGGDGIVLTGSYHRPSSVALQSDGKIVVAGQSKVSLQASQDFTVARYNTDGTLDTTFDNDGVVTTPMSSADDFRAIVIQPDGKIVAAGQALFATYDIVVVRYHPDGSLDASFDTDGKVITPIGTSTEEASAVTLQRNGKIVVAGGTVAGAIRHSTVLRYNSNGSLDTTFDGDGIVVTSTDANFVSNAFFAVAAQANGKIVAAGFAGGVGKAVRYKTNGALDSIGSFRWGTTGIVTSTISFASAITMQPNGKVIIAGYQNFGSSNNQDNRFTLERYHGDRAANFDYDRDGMADVSVYRPSEGNWYVLGSAEGSVTSFHWGISSDEIASADYDGDLKTDFAVWRSGPAAYLWILNSFDQTVRLEQFGQSGDDPSIVGDYDGDGKADPAVYRPGAAPGQQSYFYYRGSLNNPSGNTTYIPWGTNGDVAARGDYSGDGRLDPTVFRPSNSVWYSLNFVDNTNSAIKWGLSTDKPVPADYDADGRTDRAVFRNGTWFVLQSGSGLTQYAFWGISTDIPVPADYDGDGSADPAVYRDGIWHIQQSTAGNSTTWFGLSTDTPSPSAYLP